MPRPPTNSTKKLKHVRLASAQTIGLIVAALTMSSCQLDTVLTLPLATSSSIPSVNILDNISGVLFSALNNLLDSTKPLGGLGDSHFDLGDECARNSATNNGSTSSSSCLPQDPDAGRTVPEIIESRGFKVEELPVVTKDGYILTMHRILNPLVSHEERRHSLKPIILQHGLMTSSVDWVINSMDIKPRRPTRLVKRKRSASANDTAAAVGEGSPRRRHRHRHGHGHAHRARSRHHSNGDGPSDHPNGLGFYLANEGYDVFLANSRGNHYGQRHVNMSAWEPRFWDFTFDQQIKYDLPATVEHVQRVTGYRKKLAFVGHSQGTAMMLGLLAERPDYADVFEPIIMLAPVAFVGNVVSPARYFASYTPIFQHVNTWFGSSTTAVRYLAPMVCGPQVIRKELCTNLIFLSSGFNEAEFNATRLSAYLAHLPSGTSVKNLAHYGQEVNSGRFAHFDYGTRYLNEKEYGQPEAPDYPLERVRSRSLVFFTADNDWLATPKDVAKLRASLRVKPYRTYNMTEFMPKWNHVDFMYGKNSGRLVNTRILEVLREFDNDDEYEDNSSNNNNNEDNHASDR